MTECPARHPVRARSRSMPRPAAGATSATLGGPDYRAACEEISAIEVQIARIENGGDRPARPQPAQARRLSRSDVGHA